MSCVAENLDAVRRHLALDKRRWRRYFAGVEPTRLFNELRAAAAKLGIEVRIEPMGRSVHGGGLCRVGRRWRVIIDEFSPVLDQVAALAGALARFDIDAISMAPAARARVERELSSARPARAENVVPLPERAPGLRSARPRPRSVDKGRGTGNEP